jgi:hypothetical protein
MRVNALHGRGRHTQFLGCYNGNGKWPEAGSAPTDEAGHLDQLGLC